MSDHRRLVNTRQALIDAVEAFFGDTFGEDSPAGDLALLGDAWDAYDQVRRELDGAKAANRRPTSIATSRADLPDATSSRYKIIQIVTAHHAMYHRGVTVETLTKRLRGKHQTISAAVNHLAERGWLVDSEDDDVTNARYPKIRWAPSQLAVDVMCDVALAGAERS